MKIELTGVTCFALLTTTFLLFRLRRRLFFGTFNLACAAVMIAYFLRSGFQIRNGEWLVMTTGLLLYWTGLFFARVMLLRSVSLNLLVGISRGERANTMGEDIGRRLKDMQTYGMVKKAGERYSLKVFGGFWAFWVMLLYSVLRIER